MILQKLKKNKLITLVILLYGTLLLIAPDKGIQALGNSSYYLKEMLQIMPVIFVLTVVIDTWIPKETISNKLGDHSGLLGKLLSFVLGSVSAGPIYAAFPICKILLKKGASVVNIIIILSSWAVIKVPMLANEAKFLGLEFMASRWILTVLSILAMAYISGLIIKKEDITLEEVQESSRQILEVKSAYCIGCGICVTIAPDYFELKDKKGYLKSFPEENDTLDAIRVAIDKCPTKAIQFYG